MPKIVNHDERRKDIAQAVLRLVAKHGLRGASLRSVAEEVGFSTGIINHYCGDKHELILIALREATNRVGNRMKAIQEYTDGRLRILALLEMGMPLDDERAANCRIFYHLAAEGFTNENLGKELAIYYENYRQLVCSAVKSAQNQGYFLFSNAQIVSEVLVSISEGLGIQYLFDKKSMNNHKIRQDLATTLEQLSGSNEKIMIQPIKINE